MSNLPKLYVDNRTPVSVKDHNAVGDNITDDFLSIQTALSSADEIFFPTGNYVIGTTGSIGGTGKKLIFAPGAILHVSVGITLTLSGKIEAGGYQIFEVDTGASVVPGDTSNPIVMIEWFGGVADGTTDCLNAFNFSKTFIATYGGKILLQSGDYGISGTVDFNATHSIIIEGQGIKEVGLAGARGTSIKLLKQAAWAIKIRSRHARLYQLTVDGNFCATDAVFISDYQTDLLTLEKCAFTRTGARNIGTRFTENTSTNFITATGHGLNNGDAIYFAVENGAIFTTATLTSTSLPLQTGDIVYVVNKTSNTFQIAETAGGSAIDITVAGSGYQSYFKSGITSVPSCSPFTVTVDATSDLFTATAHGLAVGQAVIAGSYLSAVWLPYTLNTVYRVFSVPDADHFSLEDPDNPGNQLDLTGTNGPLPVKMRTYGGSLIRIGGPRNLEVNWVHIQDCITQQNFIDGTQLAGAAMHIYGNNAFQVTISNYLSQYFIDGVRIEGGGAEFTNGSWFTEPAVTRSVFTHDGHTGPSEPVHLRECYQETDSLPFIVQINQPTTSGFNPWVLLHQQENCARGLISWKCHQPLHLISSILGAEVNIEAVGDAEVLSIGTSWNDEVSGTYPTIGFTGDLKRLVEIGTYHASLAISGATNVNPIVISTTSDHNFSTNDMVEIANVGGNTAANGTWKITKLSSSTFSIPVTGNGTYTSGGTVRLLKPNRYNKGHVFDSTSTTPHLTSESTLLDVLVGAGDTSAHQHLQVHGTELGVRGTSDSGGSDISLARASGQSFILFNGYFNSNLTHTLHSRTGYSATIDLLDSDGALRLEVAPSAAAGANVVASPVLTLNQDLSAAFASTLSAVGITSSSSIDSSSFVLGTYFGVHAATLPSAGLFRTPKPTGTQIIIESISQSAGDVALLYQDTSDNLYVAADGDINLQIPGSGKAIRVNSSVGTNRIVIDTVGNYVSTGSVDAASFVLGTYFGEHGATLPSAGLFRTRKPATTQVILESISQSSGDMAILYQDTSDGVYIQAFGDLHFEIPGSGKAIRVDSTVGTDRVVIDTVGNYVSTGSVDAASFVLGTYFGVHNATLPSGGIIRTPKPTGTQFIIESISQSLGDVAILYSDTSDNLYLNSYGDINFQLSVAGDFRINTGAGSNRLIVDQNGNQVITGQLTVGGKIVNVTDPTSAQDAATKNYVDSRQAYGVASHQSTNNTSTYADDTDAALQVAVGSNQTWFFRFVIYQTYGAADGTKTKIVGPSGATGTINTVIVGGGGGSIGVGGIALGADIGHSTNTSAVTTHEVFITTSATSGTVKLQFAQSAHSDATNTTIEIGSFVYARRVA